MMEAERLPKRNAIGDTAVHRELLGCDAVSLGRWLPTFRSNTCNATVDWVTLQTQAPPRFETYQPTRRHIPGDFNDESNRIQSYLALPVIALTPVIPYTMVTALLWKVLCAVRWSQHAA